MSIRKAGQVIAGTPNITTGHHVGEIFWTSRLDNELNGAVDADGATYSVEAFTGEQSVPELLRKGSLPSVSMAEYESIVSANGSCRAWGWDNGDTFRVPLLKDVYLMAGQAESAGEFISESLPNITGELPLDCTITQGDRFFYNETKAGTLHGYNTNGGLTTKGSASRSSSTYQDGAKVRPDSVRYRAMVQISTGTTDEALMTCTGVLVDVGGLKDASNFTETGKETITSWGMPSGRYIDLTLGANNSFYTASANGEVFLRMSGGGVNTGYVALYYVDENDNLTGAIQNYGTGDNGVSLRVTKGQRFGIGYSSNAVLKQFRFFYAEGDKNV